MLVTCFEASLQHPEINLNIHPPPIPQYFGTAAVNFSRADRIIILQNTPFVNKLLVENTNGSVELSMMGDKFSKSLVEVENVKS